MFYNKTKIITKVYFLKTWQHKSLRSFKELLHF
jgi:hypothetical protein